AARRSLVRIWARCSLSSMSSASAPSPRSSYTSAPARTTRRRCSHRSSSTSSPLAKRTTCSPSPRSPMARRWCTGSSASKSCRCPAREHPTETGEPACPHRPDRHRRPHPRRPRPARGGGETLVAGDLSGGALGGTAPRGGGAPWTSSDDTYRAPESDRLDGWHALNTAMREKDREAFLAFASGEAEE